MRRTAADLTGRDPSLRLPVPPGDDEIARLGATLNALLARIETTLARERAFVAHASHELRTPLALLRTELELAVRRPRSTGELVAAIGSARDEVDRLERLAEDLLLLAQAGEGELPLHREPVDLAPLLEEVRSRFAGVAAAQGRVLDVAMNAEVDAEVVVEADRRQLLQVLTNLVANALDHGAGTVRLETRRDADLVDVVVSDEGAGFGPEMLPRAADRFTRSPRSTGAGLGLAIVAVIAEAHRGRYGVRDLHPGAEAWISLPAAARSAVRV
jgi:signal transduction histidine kinase